MEEEKTSEQQGAITGPPAAGERRKSSSGSAGSQGEAAKEVIRQDTTTTTITTTTSTAAAAPGNNNSVAVAKIIVDGRPPATITAVKLERSHGNDNVALSSSSEAKSTAAKLGTVVESSGDTGGVIRDVNVSADVSKAACDADSVAKSAMPSTPPPPPSVVSESLSQVEPTEDSSSQVKRIKRTPPDTDEQSSVTETTTTTNISSTKPTTEIRSPVIARLKTGVERRVRAPSMETVGSAQHEAVVDTRPRASTATSSRESKKTTQLGGSFSTPPTAQRELRTAHHPPSHFNLRLFRNPSHHASAKPLQSFGDPWVAMEGRTRSPTSSISSYSQVDLPVQKCAITSGSGPPSPHGRTQPLSDGDVRTCCDGSSGMVLTGGINNNVDVHAATKKLEKQKPAKIGSLDRFQRITGIRADSRTSSSPNMGARSASGLSSTTSPRYRELTHSRTDPSQLRTSSGRVLSPDIPRRRELSSGEITIAGKSLAERGSPWIRRRMEQRQQKAEALRKEAAAASSSTSTYK